MTIGTQQAIATEAAPAPIGPYSRAIKAGGFVLVSGQIPLDPATQRIVEGDIGVQTERVLQNIAEVLKAAGCGMEKVVRCGVFLRNIKDFEAMNTVYVQFFDGVAPARTTVAVSGLPKDALVEIDAIALA
jgi:2-iminobutanoate/2-iminopropanoate deaminase